MNTGVTNHEIIIEIKFFFREILRHGVVGAYTSSLKSTVKFAFLSGTGT